MQVSVEDALLFTVQFLKDPGRRHDQVSSYGYELYLPNVVRSFYRETAKAQLSQGSKEQASLGPPFLNAAWDLCRRGILRPGVANFNQQSTEDGSAGFGFSITAFGRMWLEEPDHDMFIPTEPERFAELLAPYRARFGSGFHERAQQANRCHAAHAYLACCAMCGAAAESVLLAAAIAKLGEEKAMKCYLGAQGRSRIETLLTGQVEDRLRREIGGFTGLLKYWRDASAHGTAFEISDTESFTAVALMLRLATCVERNWDALTT